jgi:hypothetical protein
LQLGHSDDANTWEPVEHISEDVGAIVWSFCCYENFVTPFTARDGVERGQKERQTSGTACIFVKPKRISLYFA